MLHWWKESESVPDLLPNEPLSSSRNIGIRGSNGERTYVGPTKSLERRSRVWRKIGESGTKLKTTTKTNSSIAVGDRSHNQWQMVNV